MEATPAHNAADVETKWGTVHVYESPDGIIIDVWVEDYDEPVYTMGLDHEALDPEHKHPPVGRA